MDDDNDDKPKKPTTKHRYKFNNIKPITFNTKNRKKKKIDPIPDNNQLTNSKSTNKRSLTVEKKTDNNNSNKQHGIEEDFIEPLSIKENILLNNNNDNNERTSSPKTKRAKLVQGEIDLQTKKNEFSFNNDVSVNNSNNDQSLITYGIKNYKGNQRQALGSTPVTSMRKVSAESALTSGGSPLKIISTKPILDNDLINFESIGNLSPIKSTKSSQMSKSQQRRISLKKMNTEKEKINKSEDTSSLICGLNSSLIIEPNSPKRLSNDDSIIEILETPPKLSPEKVQKTKETVGIVKEKPDNNQDMINQIKELYGSDAFETSKIDESNNTTSTISKADENKNKNKNKNDVKIDSEAGSDSDSSEDDFLFEMLQRQENTNHRAKTHPMSEKEFNDELISKLNTDLLNLLKYPKLQCKPHFPFLRLLVLHVDDADQDHIILKCSDINKKIYAIHLYAPWTQVDDTNVSPYRLNEVIHIVSFKVDDPLLLFQDEIHLSSSSELLPVIAPDTLLSGTTLSDGLTCQRQTVIKRRFALPSETSIHLTRGTIIHELFQNLLQIITKNHENLERCNNLLITETLSNMLTAIIEKYKSEIIISSDIPVDDFQYTLEKEFFPNIKNFLSSYIVDSSNNIHARINVQGAANLPFKINKIHNIEETIDSPLLGIKGIIDATINTNFGFIPMEIKTGKFASMKHQTQTMIYALLLWEKYDIPTKKFLLVYLGGEGSYILNNVNFNEFKNMLHFRNKMIHFFKDETKDHGGVLPDLLKGSSATCERECFAQETCTILNRVTRMDIDGMKRVNLDDNVLLPKEFIDTVIENISYKEKQFFENYYKMLQLEDEANALDINGYFLQSSSEKDECIGMMKLINTKQTTESEGVEDRFELIFQFDNHLKNEVNGVSLYDNCILSDEMGHYRLDYVTVLEVDYSKGIVKTLGTKNIMTSIQKQYRNIILFRLDRAFYDIPNKIAKFNLVSLLNQRNTVLKNLIIHPEQNLSNQRMECFKSFNVEMINWSKLNEDQCEAVKKCLSSDKYSLIRGMPGTGKTQVITELLKCLIMNKKRVLITSFTHSAVDNIILKLIENGFYDEKLFKIVRLGQQSNVNKKVQQFMITNNIENYHQLQTKYKEANLIATTCLSVHNFMVKEILKVDNEADVPLYQKFDYCILDEATQVNLPISLAPLEWSKKFILVGDDNQLSPLVKSKKAIEMGLKESLFTRLSKIDSRNVTNLTIQYRMNEDIMKLSNFLVYNNMLKCGDFNRKKYLPEIKDLDKKYDTNSLEYKILNNKQSVLFIDYRNKLTNEKDSSYTDNITKDSLVNIGEVKLIKDILDLFNKNYDNKNNDEFNPVDDIGILSIYRAQLNLLTTNLTSQLNLETSTENTKHLEILTADQYQGRDKKCIIISFVKSNFDKDVNKTIDDGILNDLERINVSITRSKCKLIMIGNSNTLSNYKVLKKLFDGIICKEKEKYVHEI